MRKTISFVLFLSLFATAAHSQNAVVIQGADTLILLAQRWTQIYRQKQPQVDISVRGGGSSSGLKAVAGGPATVAQLEGGTKPDSGITFPVGVEGIAVYVNRSNPVNQLSLEQLRGIFLGETTNWKQVGGPDKRILLYAGESSTGILPYFQESVLRGEEPYPYEGKVSAKDLVETIAAQPDGIGYSSLYTTTKVKILRINSGQSLPVEATIENVRSRRYPISRYVYWHLAAKPSGQFKELCNWVLSREGQLVVESVGFEPLTPEDRATGLAKLR